MKNRTPVSLFPFLSVLLSTMGVLSFLAVTFLLLSGTNAPQKFQQKPIQVRWVGAPPHVRPLLVECRKGEVIFHAGGGYPLQKFQIADLEREVNIIKSLLAEGAEELGPTPSSTQRWFYFKTIIPQVNQLRNSFTRLFHDIEIDNYTGKSRQSQIERYPILLVYPGGLESYELASYLLEMTTRLATGLEPMLKGWDLPYQDLGT